MLIQGIDNKGIYLWDSIHAMYKAVGRETIKCNAQCVQNIEEVEHTS